MKPDSQNLGPLREGATVVVIGGGPGGTAAAISLKKYARALGRSIKVIVVEGKLFSGDVQYNQCAGVVSPPIAQLLPDELDVPFPWDLCQRTIDRYVLHTSRRQIELVGKAEPSYALRRVQFDNYMLESVRKQGIHIHHARVTDIEFHADRVVIYTDNSPLVADVVVGAFGLDEGTAAIFQRAVGYGPPPSLNSVVTKFHPETAFLQNFGSGIHVFLPTHKRIGFGAITPKENHLTINIAGKTADADLMDSFFSLPEVKAVLSTFAGPGMVKTQPLSYFKGRFPRGLAKNYTGDRFIMIGDAAGLVRAFKGKGITSAIQTGIRAARVILSEGISKTAFQAYHAANQDILEDLPYGQAMRLFTILSSSTGIMDVAIGAAEIDPGLRQAFFDAVSAHRSYKEVVRRIISPSSVSSIAKAFFFPNSMQKKAA